MDKAIKRIVSFIPVLVFVWSCSSNRVFVDYNQQLIIPSKSLINTGISFLEYRSDSIWCYVILSESVSKLDPFHLPDDCTIIGDVRATILQKGKDYCIINRSNGDAGPFELRIRIDSTGRIKPPR